MANKVFYDDDARKRVLAGAEILYNAVKTTMGPKGRNVIIDRPPIAPTVTHDGVTVAKGVDIPVVDDETLGYKVGADLIKQAANKMNDVAGDGTTTVTVLTYHILNEANKLIAAGHNPMQLRKGLEKAAEAVLSDLAAQAEDIITDNSDRVQEIATISSGDAAIGALIAEVMEAVGKEGVVTVEESQGLKLEAEIVKGYNLASGFVSPYMTTNPERMEAVYNNPAIIITDKHIHDVQAMVPFLERLVQAGRRDVLLICDDIDAEPMGALIINKLKHVLNVVAVRAPYGNKEGYLQDVATLTGATVVTDNAGLEFDNAELAVCGTARKVIVTKDKTTIIEGAGPQEDVDARIKELKAQAKVTTNSFDVDILDRRRGALANSVAVIKVGGQTETEIEEKKYRVDDAVAAAKAAMAEGIVPGGGVTLLALADKMAIDNQGAHLLWAALSKPFRILTENAGLAADEYLYRIRESKFTLGVDLNGEDTLVDLKENGIVDPVRVTKEAIQNAVSIAGTAMTMGALVVELPEEQPQLPPMPPGMAM